MAPDKRVVPTPPCNKAVKLTGYCSTHGPSRHKCDKDRCNLIVVQGGQCITNGAHCNGQEQIDAKKATIKLTWSPKLTQTFIKWLSHTEEGGKLVYNQ